MKDSHRALTFSTGYPSETGLLHNVARDYEPGTGRYVQSDPIGLWGGLNTFSYVHGNPLRYIDPLGLAVGHHYFPRAVFESMDLSADAHFIFDKTTTGPLNEPHRWSEPHARYNEATEELFDKFVARRGIDPARMTSKQAYDFLEAIGNSRDPRIRNFLLDLEKLNRMKLIRKLFRKAPALGIPLVCLEMMLDENYSFIDALNDQSLLMYGEDLH